MTVRPAQERLRDQQRRELIGRIVIAVGALAATAVTAALLLHGAGW